ncbi:MAG: hypothetical protein JKY41_14265 [Rhodobacteraceae bacterium]|nr:hypothetical protein [Paracoccaceae bacterium]
MNTQNEILTKIRNQLNGSIEDEHVNIRNIYRLKGHLNLFDETLRNEFNQLIEEIDDHILSGDDTAALQNIERMAGIIDAQLTELGMDDNGIGTTKNSDLAYFAISDAEREAITMLASDMRKIVSTSQQFDNPHKVRLLKRISAIEQEVHKEKGLFDVILGGVNDIGETAGKFGDDVKPLMERMAEIEQITRGKSPDYAQLEKPNEVLKIENKTDEGGDD